MRIEKINEHQIRCTLYQKDLKDREIRISELAYGTEKARALFRDMMQQASYEFGFEADDIPLMIEAIPMLPDALILLITKVEDPDELDTRFSNFTDDPSEHYLDDSSTDDFVIINDDEEFDADDFDIDGPDSAEDLNIEQMLNEVNSQTKWPGRGKADAVLDQLFHGNVQKESKDNKATADKNKPDINLEHPMEPDVDVNEALVDITRIFSFSSLEKLVEMCGHLRNFYNGPNTASAIIQKYHSLDKVFEHLEELKPPKAKTSITENIEQIKMSRFLSEIKTDVPIEYNIEDAKAGDFFNENSYELFKKYNFKNMLKKFENTDITAKDPDCYEYFKKISDFAEVENVFNKAAQIADGIEKIGLSIIRENELTAVGITLSDTEIYYIPVSGFVTENYLIERLLDVVSKASHRNIASANIKDYLDIFEKDKINGYPLVSEKAFIDTAIAAYLLHPSNESYDYESLGREFLSLTYRSEERRVGKECRSRWSPYH